MTVDEKVNALQSDDFIYLGCKEGSGFVFIGTKDEYEKYIDVIDSQIFDSYEKAIRKHKSELADLEKERERSLNDTQSAENDEIDCRAILIKELDNVNQRKTQEIEDAENNHLKSISELRKAQTELKRADNTISNRQKKIAEISLLLRKWIPLRARTVEEYYKRDVDVPGWVILVNGETEGKYWMRKEFEKWIDKHSIEVKENEVEQDEKY